MSLSRPEPESTSIAFDLTCWLETRINPRYEALRKLSAVLEEECTNRYSEFTYSQANHIRDCPPELTAEIHDHFEANWVEFWQNELTPQRVGMLMTVYSLTEITVTEICEYAGKKLGLDLRVTDLGDRGLNRCWKYLIKCVKVPATQLESEFQLLLMIGTLRNCLAHSGLYAHPSIKEKLKSYSNNLNEAFRVTESGEIELTNLTVNCLITVSQRLINGLCEELPKAIARKEGAEG